MTRSSAARSKRRPYGRIGMMIVPGADDMQRNQPTHNLAYDL